VQLLVYGDVNSALAAETAAIFARAFAGSVAMLPEEARSLKAKLRPLTKGIWGVQRKGKRANENDSGVFSMVDLGMRLTECEALED